MLSLSRGCGAATRAAAPIILHSTVSTSPVSSTATPVLQQQKRDASGFAQSRSLHTSLRALSKNYYETLGVKKEANAKDIKKAYFQLAKKFHPDVNKTKEAQTKFQEISEAYEILSDEGKRQEYDTYGSTGGQGMGGMGGGGMGGRGGSGQQWHYQNPEDIFRHAFKNFAGFGGGAGGGFNWSSFAESAAGHNAAQEMVMDLAFEEAVRGTVKSARVNVVEDCRKCKGTQVEPGYKKVACPYCNGTGMKTQRMQGGFFMQQVCNRCAGSGSYNKNPCGDCEGHGQSVQQRQVSFNVPAGTNDQDRIRFTVGKSQVYVHFNVAPSLKFRRDGDDLHCDVDINIAQAILGGTVKVPGIVEDTYVHVSPGTSSHSLLRLSGKGVKRKQAAGHGDQYIHIKVAVPKSISSEQRKLMQAWARLDKPKTGTVKGLEDEEKKEQEQSKKEQKQPKKEQEQSKEEEEVKREDKTEEKAQAKQEKKHETSQKVGATDGRRAASQQRQSPAEQAVDENEGDGFLGKIKRKIFGCESRDPNTSFDTALSRLMISESKKAGDEKEKQAASS